MAPFYGWASTTSRVKPFRGGSLRFTIRFKMKSITSRCGSKTAATSKMELFVIIVNGFQSLTIITKCSILDAAAVLDLPRIDYVKKDVNSKTFSIKIKIKIQTIIIEFLKLTKLRRKQKPKLALRRVLPSSYS